MEGGRGGEWVRAKKKPPDRGRANAKLDAPPYIRRRSPVRFR